MTISRLGGRHGGGPRRAAWALGEELERGAEGGGTLARKVHVKSIQLSLKNRFGDLKTLLGRLFHLLVAILSVGRAQAVVVGAAVALSGGGGGDGGGGFVGQHADECDGLLDAFAEERGGGALLRIR